MFGFKPHAYCSILNMRAYDGLNNGNGFPMDKVQMLHVGNRGQTRACVSLGGAVQFHSGMRPCRNIDSLMLYSIAIWYCDFVL